MSGNDIVVEMENIVKSYGNIRANDHVDFSASSGRIHTIVGENGAGKSTLVKILSGVVVPDSGDIRIRGELQEDYSPQKAYSCGVGMVYQDFMLVPTMSVTENVILGFEPVQGLSIDFKNARKRIEQITSEYDISIPTECNVSELSVGQKQKLEIIKLIYRDTDIYIFDEPTSVLVPSEVEGLFRIFANLQERSKTVLFITHKIEEVFRVSDDISVMRNGKMMVTDRKDRFTRSDIIFHMIGKRGMFSSLERKELKHTHEVFLKVKDLVKEELGKRLLDRISFSIPSGKIVGIAGVEGNGQRELINCILGIERKTSGEVMTGGGGEDSDISFIPEDTVKMGIIPDFTLRDNFILGMDSSNRFRRFIFFDRENMDEFAKDSIDKYNIKSSGIHARVDSLSGGNIQKVVLARELSKESRLIIANHPTRGLDISACDFIHRILIDKRNNGDSVLLVSSDLNELVILSDYIHVIFEGRLSPPIPSERFDKYEIGKLMTGKKEIGSTQ